MSPWKPRVEWLHWFTVQLREMILPCKYYSMLVQISMQGIELVSQRCTMLVSLRTWKPFVLCYKEIQVSPNNLNLRRMEVSHLWCTQCKVTVSKLLLLLQNVSMRAWIPSLKTILGKMFCHTLLYTNKIRNARMSMTWFRRLKNNGKNSSL